MSGWLTPARAHISASNLSYRQLVSPLRAWAMALQHGPCTSSQPCMALGQQEQSGRAPGHLTGICCMRAGVGSTHSPLASEPRLAWAGMVQRRLSNGVRLNYIVTDYEPGSAVMRINALGGRFVEPQEAGPAGAGVIGVGARTISEAGAVGQLTRQQLELFSISQLFHCTVDADDEALYFDCSFTPSAPLRCRRRCWPVARAAPCRWAPWPWRTPVGRLLVHAVTARQPHAGTIAQDIQACAPFLCCHCASAHGPGMTPADSRVVWQVRTASGRPWRRRTCSCRSPPGPRQPWTGPSSGGWPRIAATSSASSGAPRSASSAPCSRWRGAPSFAGSGSGSACCSRALGWQVWNLPGCCTRRPELHVRQVRVPPGPGFPIWKACICWVGEKSQGPAAADSACCGKRQGCSCLHG